MAPEGRKVGSLNRRVLSHPSGEMKDDKLHTAVARSTFASEKAKSTSHSEHFGSSDVEKMYAVVARSTFRSQNAKNTTCSRHFWTLKRRCVRQAQGILHPAKSEQKREGFVAHPKQWQVWGI